MATSSSSSTTTPSSTATTPSTILNLSFNQDNRCFSVATTTGFTLCTTEPFHQCINRHFTNGLTISQMLNNTNILALVGSGPGPFPLNKVIIWDDHQSRSVGELCFRSQIRSVRLRRNWIVVALLQKIYVYELSDLKLLFQMETAENPKGVCEVSQLGSSSLLLVCMGIRHEGQVQVVRYPNMRTRFVEAHESGIACVGLARNGRVMATASNKGTVIRVFNALDGSLIHELRRGYDSAKIESLSFSFDAQWLAVSSSKGTVHVFSLKATTHNSGSLKINSSTEQNSPTQPSHLSFIKGLWPKYPSYAKSLAQFRVPKGLQHIVAFGRQENTVIVIGFDGSFYRCQFDPDVGGTMTQLERHNFMSTSKRTP